MKSVRRFPGAFWRLARGRARREDGQALLLVVGGLVALMAMAGFVIDIGRVYVAQQQLQAAVESASLAAAQNMPDPVNAQTSANLYSMAPAGTPGCTGSCLNANPQTATATTPIVKTYCITTIPGGATPTNVPCQVYTGPANSSGYSCNGNLAQGSPSTAGCNAVQVSESAKVNTTFLNVVGVGSLFSAITSKSTVLMRGGTPHPLDVEIVLDVSGSMNQACTDSNSKPYVVANMNTQSSKLDCAKEGIRSLISTLWPCDPSLTTCPTPNTAPVDKVGLEIFPGLNAGVFTSELDCGWNLTYADEGYSNSAGYDAVGLSSDYRTSDTTSNVNGNLVGTSQLVEATSWSSCNQGTWPPGNDPAFSNGTPGNQSKYGAEAPNCTSNCTFFADAIGNAAVKICQDDYGNASCSGPQTRKAQGVIILLSDGDANTRVANACQAAVQLANTIAFAPYNDWVFSIGYDTPATGCVTDTPGAHSEVEQITTSATGGTFTVTYGGVTNTGTIAYNASSAAMLTALNTIPALNGNVSVTGGGGGGSNHQWTVTFKTALANMTISPSPGISGTATGLTWPGQTPAVVVNTQTYGTPAGSNYNPFTTMQAIASDPSKFFCLHPPSGQTCNGANAANLNQIFKDVGTDITGARVISNP